MPRFRVGRSVPLNVYDGDRSVCQAHSVEDARKIVQLLNLGDTVELVDEIGIVTDEQWDRLTSPETPLSSPESASEPTDAPEGPTDDRGPFLDAWGELWDRPAGWSGHWCGFRPTDPCDACFERVHP